MGKFVEARKKFGIAVGFQQFILEEALIRCNY